jgi:hypothetical protein
MTEYTSLDVSRRLTGAGFDVDSDGTYQQDPFGEDKGGWQLYRGHETCRYNPNVILAYRADTLMEWLMEKGLDVLVGRRKGRVYAIARCPNPIDDNLSSRHGYTCYGDKIPDAFGEVVLALLAKEAEHGKQG